MAGIAQLVEPRIVIPVVAGSRPVSRPIFISLKKACSDTGFFLHTIFKDSIRYFQTYIVKPDKDIQREQLLSL